ncbi:hypothetical protein T03_16161, partial [Trichinella britovi]
LRHVNLISTLALTFRSFSLNFNNFENGILFWKGGFADVQRYVMLWLERSAAFTFSCSIYCYVSGVMHMVNSNIQISITEAIEYNIFSVFYLLEDVRCKGVMNQVRNEHGVAQILCLSPDSRLKRCHGSGSENVQLKTVDHVIGSPRPI